MKALFRCDAGTHIGTGHLMRCLTLAQALRDAGTECHFACRDHSGSAHALISERGFTLSVLPAPPWNYTPPRPTRAHAQWLGVSATEDVQDTIAAVSGSSATVAPYDWLIVDHYALDAGWETPMRAQARNILAIDDLADRKHDCELLLDQNLSSLSQHYDGLVPAHCQRLIGLEFALLRPEFGEWREHSLKRRSDGPLEKLMISLGGMDADNMSGQLLQALHESGWTQDLRIDIILGPTAPHADAVRQLVTQLNDELGATGVYEPRITLAQGIDNMAEQLAVTDLVIGAAGSSSWERCCLGVPTILIVLADNQRLLAAALESAGAAVTVDLNAASNPHVASTSLDHALAHCRERLAEMQGKAALLLDGQGAERVAARMLCS